MAIVRRLDLMPLEKNSRHTETNCTYSIVLDDDGRRYLQVGTYGSGTREILDKKSQSIRFSPEAIEQLKTILQQL